MPGAAGVIGRELRLTRCAPSWRPARRQVLNLFSDGQRYCALSSSGCCTKRG